MSTKAFKQDKIDFIKSKLENAKVAIVTNYRGLSVEEISELRLALQKENGDFTVTKNTLTKVAIQGTEYEKLADFLKGPTAIAVGYSDQVAPAKVLTKFIKETKKAEIIGCVLDGQVFDAEQTKALANIPSKEELYAKILGSINSPASGIANSISAVMRSLVYAMEQVRKQKEQA